MSWKFNVNASPRIRGKKFNWIFKYHCNTFWAFFLIKLFLSYILQSLNKGRYLKIVLSLFGKNWERRISVFKEIGAKLFLFCIWYAKSLSYDLMMVNCLLSFVLLKCVDTWKSLHFSMFYFVSYIFLEIFLQLRIWVPFT